MSVDAAGTPHFSPAAPAFAGNQWWDTRLQLGTDGYILAIASSGSDIYVGGYFTHVGGIAANHIAKWNTLTHTWSALGMGVDSEVYAITVSGNHVYAGGLFSHAGGVSANLIASWNTSTASWAGLGSGMASTGFAVVRALVIDGAGNLIAGGTFTSAGGVSAMNIAKWNGASWTDIGGGLGSPGDFVRALAVSGTNIYAGGSFSLPPKNIAMWNGAAWLAVSGGVSGVVTAIAVSGSNVYVGGNFTSVGGTAANYIALWNGTFWSTLGSGVQSTVYALAVGTDGLYVGGDFTQVGSYVVSHVARWNGSSWSALQGNTSITAGTDNKVSVLAANGNDIYVGGDFVAAGSHAAMHIARWSSTDTNWYALGNSVNDRVNAVAVHGSDVYVGGYFTSVGGIPAKALAKWNSASNQWSTLGSGLAGCNSNLCTTQVSAIVMSGSDVYVGGNFTAAGGIVVNNIARWNGSVWSALAGGVTGCPSVGCSVAVNTLDAHGGTIVVGGYFKLAGAITSNSVANWNGSSWSALTDIDSNVTGTNGYVDAVLYDGLGNWYIGGNFTSPKTNLAYFDGFNFYGTGSALNGTVYALAQTNTRLYVGGLFTNAANSGANYLAQMNTSVSGADWQPLANSPDYFVFALSLAGNTLYVAGDFSNIGVLGANHIAAWNALSNSWSGFGSGIDGNVYALATGSGDVIASGVFLNAGAMPSTYLARWSDVIFRNGFE